MAKKKTAKKMLMEHVKETGRIKVLDFDDFAYFDEKVNRWRAGKYCTTRKAGTFLTAAHAQRIRASVSTSVYASKQAVRIAKQRVAQGRRVTNEQALVMGYQWVREYRKAKRQFEIRGIPSARKRAFEYVDELFNLDSWLS